MASLLTIRILLGLGIFGLVTSTVYTALVLGGVRRFRMRSRRIRQASCKDEIFCPPVTLFKPLHGAEPNLAAHLESFFLQNYPKYEILFCARTANDAGLDTARQVAAKYPHIPVRFLTTGEATYVNAKVSSLERMETAARYDLFVISDSDVRVTPSYLHEVVAPFADEKTGGVTCLYRGVADKGLWSKLEAAGMSIEMTAGVLAAELMEGMQFMLGPTMAVRRSGVAEIGGFSTLGQYCADDFLLGNRIAANGHTIALSNHVIDHMILNLSFKSSVKHQVRWMKSTRFSRPKGHFGTSLTFSVPFGLLSFAAAWAMHRPMIGVALLAYSIAARMALAVVVGAAVVGEPHLLRTILLYPLRDFLGFCYWAGSYGSSKVLWRGQVYRLCESGLMQSTKQQVGDEREPAVLA